MALQTYVSPNQENDYTTGTFKELLPSYAQTTKRRYAKEEIDNQGGENERQADSNQNVPVSRPDLVFITACYSISRWHHYPRATTV